MNFEKYKNLKRCIEKDCNAKEECQHIKVFEMAIDMFKQAKTRINKAQLLVIMMENGTHCKQLMDNPKFRKYAKQKCKDFKVTTLSLTGIDLVERYKF